jgi:hypothetical protein
MLATCTRETAPGGGGEGTVASPEVLWATLFSRGILCEVVARGASCGGQLCLLSFLLAARAEGGFAALVDGGNAFDPQTACGEALEHLLWVRCGELRTALQCADTLLRDENFPLILVDLRAIEERQLRRTPLSLWYRMQRLARRNETRLALFTARETIPSAHLRLAFTAPLPLASLDEPVRALARALPAEVVRSRLPGAVEGLRMLA